MLFSFFKNHTSEHIRLQITLNVRIQGILLSKGRVVAPPVSK
ncbi:hypothetical protein [uncultured Gammaproteobacteria bacterium]|nr:hypothetical protein [uncultured Gammaproteobacteria bacterium]